MAKWIAFYVIWCVAAVMLLTRLVNRRVHHNPDPVVIREFAYRMRSVRRALKITFAILGVLFAIGALAMFMSEIPGLVTFFSVFTVAAIVVPVALAVVNKNYICPACGERPILPRDEGGIQLRVRECERCGVSLE